MGRIAQILFFNRNPKDGINKSDVKINPDGGSNVNAQHFSSPGDDSVPLTTDFVATTKVQGSGREAAVGYADPKNVPKALAGDKRIYSRDAAGDVISEIWLKNDGTIEATNAGGLITLKPDGTLDVIANTKINIIAPLVEFVSNVIIQGNLTLGGAISAISGTITGTGGMTMTGGDVTADGKSLKTHIHTAGTPPGNTGPPV